MEFKSPHSQSNTGFNTNNSYSYGGEDEETSRDPARRHIAGLAAAASRAMRRWKLHHSVMTAAAQKALTE